MLSFPRTILVGVVSLCILLGSLITYKQFAKPQVIEASTPTVTIDTRETPLFAKVSEEAPKERTATKSGDRIRRLFTKGQDKLPIVETITYSSRVPWITGRPAWLVDYASHYNTSRHFIARSLNGRADYETQTLSTGDTFNIIRPEANIEFYLLVSISELTLDLYYLDLDKDARVFLKSYPVGLGRISQDSPSGSLTPLGKYTLGSKISSYKPGTEQVYRNQTTEMIQIFGTRWMPFAEEISGCTDRAKGYGIHGVPCYYDEEAKELIEQFNAGVNAYNSDGCIRLSKEHVEELYAILAAHTEKTTIEIVECRSDVALPMAQELEV